MKITRTLSTVPAVFLAIFTLSSAAEQRPAVDIPDTPAGRNFAAFLKSYNTNDSAVWMAFLKENYSRKPDDSATSIERRMGVFSMLQSELGSIKPVKINSSEQYSLTVILEPEDPDKVGDFLEIKHDVYQESPHSWAMSRLESVGDPFMEFPPLPISNDDLDAWLDKFIDQLVTEDRFSGTVLVARDGVPIYTRAEGLASRRYNVPNTLNTKFNLGSMNKMFTGVAISQLVQQGKLRFDDPIIKHIPDYPRPEIAEKVMIHHLLTHTSGLGHYWEEIFDTSFWEIQTVDGYYQLANKQDLQFEPGTDWSYSNFGPIVLGIIIENVTGMSYYDYIEKNIYKPAGMINSGCFPIDQPVPNLAMGFTKHNYDETIGDTWRINYFMHSARGGPAGGGYSTVEDLLAFANALKNHKLLNAAYTDTVTTGKADIGPDMKYAYLFGESFQNGHRIVGHNGGAPGINAVLSIYWDDGYTVAVMGNQDGAAMPVAQSLRRLLTQPPEHAEN